MPAPNATGTHGSNRPGPASAAIQLRAFPMRNDDALSVKPAAAGTALRGGQETARPMARPARPLDLSWDRSRSSPPPPAIALLRSLFAAGAPRLLRAMHSLAGAVAAIGLGLWVVPIGEDGPSWEIYSSAGPTLRSLDAQAPLVLVGALMVLAAGILLAAVLDVRDELVRRWPMRADPSPAAEA